MGDLKKNESNIWCFNPVFYPNRFSYMWKRNTCELFQLTWGLFVESPETFRVYFGCLNFLYIIATSRFWAIKLLNSLVFSYLKNMLKDQLFKTSSLKFDNWLFGPRVLGSLDRPLRSIALRKLSRENQSNLRYSASHWGLTVLLYSPSHRKPLFNMEKRLKAIWQPCWCPQLILWELNSIFTQICYFVLVENVLIDHVSEKHSIGTLLYYFDHPNELHHAKCQFTSPLLSPC